VKYIENEDFAALYRIPLYPYNGIVASMWEIQHRNQELCMLGCPSAPSPDRSSYGTFVASQIDWSRFSLTFGPSQPMIAIPALWLFICLTVPRSRLCVPSCHVHMYALCISMYLPCIVLEASPAGLHGGKICRVECKLELWMASSNSLLFGLCIANAEKEKPRLPALQIL
jgi:hypothetical protein